MPLGDSITLGVNGGYRNELFNSLTAAGCGVNYVGSQSDPYAVIADHDHEGHPGFTISDISSSVDSWLATSQPDYVLLMIGTNDIAWWSAETAAQISDRHALLVDKILADRPNAWVIVATFPPITSAIIQPNNVDRAQLGHDLNTEIKIRMVAKQAAGKGDPAQVECDEIGRHVGRRHAEMGAERCRIHDLDVAARLGRPRVEIDPHVVRELLAQPQRMVVRAMRG
jgi:lysophospholipase L1-like esterase